MIELKTCPQCGNKPNLLWSDDVFFKHGKRAYVYSCVNCHIRAKSADSISEAEKNWNTKVNNVDLFE